ncbi:MAG: DUF3828 domain-containing protein [Muribaculaceae bacterium]|nr:DUF3828 domain-containing protein [Muribaculaceae bacterium]
MKIYQISAIIILSAIVASCTGNSSKKNTGNETTDSTELAAKEPIEVLENDPKQTDAIKRTILLAYFDPTLTPETERIYSKSMLNQFKELGFKNEVKRTDLMSDDFKKTWDQFNRLDPEAMMEFLDWDLFYCGQDIYDLNVTIDKILFDSETSATANIKVTNSDQTTPLTIKLIQAPSGNWKIDDITWKSTTEFVKQPMKKYTASYQGK